MISMQDYVNEQKSVLKDRVSRMESKPTLMVIQVGDNQASNAYVRGKKKDCEEIGINCIHKCINNDIQTQLNQAVLGANQDDNIDGIIIQLPLPKGIVAPHIVYNKDVDNLNLTSHYSPCTPKGIIQWLEYNNVELDGKNVTIIGRSNIVGKPLARMMTDKNATVTLCHSHTKDLSKCCEYADIIVTAVGKPKYLKNINICKNKVIIIDVGINRDENNKLCGDVDYNEIIKNDNLIYCTPVPKGVGLTTRLALIQNIIISKENKTI